MLEQMHTPKQAAELLGISERSLRRAVKDGQIQVIITGGSKCPRYLITQRALERWQATCSGYYTDFKAPAKKTKGRSKKQLLLPGTEYDKNGNVVLARKKSDAPWPLAK